MNIIFLFTIFSPQTSHYLALCFFLPIRQIINLQQLHPCLLLACLQHLLWPIFIWGRYYIFSPFTPPSPSLAPPPTHLIHQEELPDHLNLHYIYRIMFVLTMHNLLPPLLLLPLIGVIWFNSLLYHPFINRIFIILIIVMNPTHTRKLLCILIGFELCSLKLMASKSIRLGQRLIFLLVKRQ